MLHAPNLKLHLDGSFVELVDLYTRIYTMDQRNQFIN